MTMSSASSAERMHETTTEESEVNFDEDEMMRQLLEMAGDDADNVSIRADDSDLDRVPVLMPRVCGETAEDDNSADQDFSNNNMVDDYTAQPDSQPDGKQSYLQRRFGELDVLYEEEANTKEYGSSREILAGGEGMSATSMLTERERELIKETCRDSRSSKRGFTQRSSSADSARDDELKAKGSIDILGSSFDSYEYHSDSEIKPTSKSRMSRDFQEMSNLSGSDPKLISAVDSPSRDSISSTKETLEKLFVPQSVPDEFAIDEKYRSVEDLTKIGKEESDTVSDPDNGSTRIATPAVGQPQFQYPRQKPNSLPRRRRSRPVMELPLSPIFDEETGSPDLEHPAGDFSSPEYADPSLAEDSPFEYEYDDDADASQEGFSSQDELARTELMEDLKTMEDEPSEQHDDYVDDFTLGSREEGLSTLVEEQEETQESDFSRESRQPPSSIIGHIHRVPDSPMRTPPSDTSTPEKHNAEQTAEKGIDSEEERKSRSTTDNTDEADRQSQSPAKEHFKHLPRHSQDDVNSSSSLTSSQSSDEPPETVRSNKDVKDGHSQRPKPPPLGTLPARYSMEAYSSLDSEEGNSLLSSPRTPSYDTDSFERPKVVSPGRKAVDLDSPLSPSFRFSPPATPKHLLEASKHINDDSYPYDNSPSEMSDEIQMSPVTLTVCKSVVTHMGSSFDDYSDTSPAKTAINTGIGPAMPSDLDKLRDNSQNTEEEQEIGKKKATTADACTGTQTEHILSVMIPKTSSPFRRSEEEKLRSVKMHSTSSQTTSPVSGSSAGSSPVKQTKSKVLIDAAVDATFDSPSISPLSPMHAAHHAKTASVAVGTSPEYSPPSSAPSTDTESVASRSSRVKYVHGGFGSDGDTTDWGASMPFSSIASSSGTSSPERSSSLRSTPLKYLPLESSSASNASSPAARRSRADRETSTQRGSSAPGRTRMMRDSVSSERRVGLCFKCNIQAFIRSWGSIYEHLLVFQILIC